MKCALSYAKQQKILVLEKQNHILSKQLEQLLKSSEQLTSGLKSSNLQITSLKTQIQVEQVHQSLMKISIANLEKQKIEADCSLNRLTQNLEQIQSINKQLNVRLHEHQKEKQEAGSMLDRLKKQLKMYKKIGNSESSVVKSCNNLKKTHQCLLRTLNILKDKLESHKRYLVILQKKQLKEEQESNLNNMQNKHQGVNRAKSSTNIKNILKNQRINAQFEKVQRDDKKKMKQFSELTRHKNQLLMKAKK